MNEGEIYRQAVSAAESGNFAEAERLCRALMATIPSHFHAMALLGELLLLKGRTEEAHAVFVEASSTPQGEVHFFSRRVTTEFRLHFGAPPPQRKGPGPGAPRIQMTTLGTHGRFGNQLLQYAYMRFVADENGLVAEVPDWIGRDIFDFDDPLPSTKLPQLDERVADLFGALNLGQAQKLRDRDIVGYLTGHTARWGARAEKFRTLYAPGAKIRKPLQDALDILRAAGSTIVALHIRRGDFGYGQFWPAPSSWYLPWLRALWPRLKRPVLYIATDEPSEVTAFAEFAPWDWCRLGLRIPGADFIIDHHVLRHADHLAIANSTFSFTAAMLNERAQSFMRPHPSERTLVPFAPWSSDPSLRPRAQEEDEDEKAILRSYFKDTDSVLYLGQVCAPWTNSARLMHRYMTIVEAEPATSVDALRRQRNLGQITHLVIEDASSLAGVLAAARESLRHARIDVLHVRVGRDGIAAQDLSHLTDNGYVLYRVSGMSALSVAALAEPGHYMAVQQRIIPFLFNGENKDLDIASLCRTHGIEVRGVIHVGAHEGHEIHMYEAMGAKRVVYIEANPDVFARLKVRMADHPSAVCINKAASDAPGNVLLHLASFDQSSSLLPLARHREVYPDIAEVGTVMVEAARLDDILQSEGYPEFASQLLSIDVQGAEVLVLKGASQTLRSADAVHIEVNFTEMYKGGAQIEDVDDLLVEAGFRRIALASAFDPSWGDAFYVRRPVGSGT